MTADDLTRDLRDLRQLLLYSGFKRTSRRPDGVEIFSRADTYPYYLPSHFHGDVAHAERARLALNLAAVSLCPDCGFIAAHGSKCSQRQVARRAGGERLNTRT